MAQLIEIICCIIALCGNMEVKTLAITILICEGIKIICELIEKYGD